MNATAPDGDTPLHVASDTNADGMVKLLVSSGIAIDAVNERGETPLSSALSEGRYALATALLREVERLLCVAAPECVDVQAGLFAMT